MGNLYNVTIKYLDNFNNLLEKTYEDVSDIDSEFGLLSICLANGDTHSFQLKNIQEVHKIEQ